MVTQQLPMEARLKGGRAPVGANNMSSTGLSISREFINSTLLPLLKQWLPNDFDRLAVAIVGTGSEILGMDDEISRDHHWGPRANVMYLRADADRLRDQLRRLFDEKLPATYGEHAVHANIGNLTGVCCGAVEDFFLRFLGTDKLPAKDLDWLALCEVDLFHVTAGEVVYDGPGELTRRRQALAYYPANVWRKRIADWCMYVTGRDAPYNIHRVSKRHDDVTCTIYLGLCAKRLMELCFALNCRYAPYTKWLDQTYRKLPKYAGDLAPLLDRAFGDSSWKERVHLLVEANYVVADALADLDLTDPPVRRSFDDCLTDLTLYDSAAQIYSKLPSELFAPSFNQIELWERMAREVLFDSNDYFRNIRDKSH